MTTTMMNRTWKITFNGHVVVYQQDYNVPDGKVAERGTTMARSLDVFLDGLEKMRAAGAIVEEGTR